MLSRSTKLSTLFPSVTWIIHEQLRRECERVDAQSGWGKRCCFHHPAAAFTHTAGAYITVSLPVLTLSSPVSLPLPTFTSVLSICVCVYQCIDLTLLTPTHTLTHTLTLTQMSNQYLYPCRVWIGHDLHSSESVPTVEKSKSSSESWKSMWDWVLTGSREVAA